MSLAVPLSCINSVLLVQHRFLLTMCFKCDHVFGVELLRYELFLWNITKWVFSDIRGCVSMCAFVSLFVCIKCRIKCIMLFITFLYILYKISLNRNLFSILLLVEYIRANLNICTSLQICNFMLTQGHKETILWCTAFLKCELA